MELRIDCDIVTHLKGDSSVTPGRDLAIDFTLQNAVMCRQQLAGHYYLSKDADTRRVFTFSPSLHEYDHSEFRRFVLDLKLRRECRFNFETSGYFTGFTYRNGSLTFSSSHIGNDITVYMKCTDSVVRDMETLCLTIERYMELCISEIEVLEHALGKLN